MPSTITSGCGAAGGRVLSSEELDSRKRRHEHIDDWDMFSPFAAAADFSAEKKPCPNLAGTATNAALVQRCRLAKSVESQPTRLGQMERLLALPEPETMASIFVPGAAPGAAKPDGFKRYCRLLRKNLLHHLEKERNNGHQPDINTGASLKLAIDDFHVVALELGGELAARSSACARGSYGKFHTLLSDRKLWALKVMRTTESPHSGKTAPVTLAAARREAALLKKYACPEVRLFVDQQTQRLGLQMELALGTIDAVPCDLEAPFQAELRAACMMEQVAIQLAKMHADGVYHLDVKPDNILVFGDGSIRICDMGKVRFADEEVSWGTMAYLPPEAFQGLAEETLLGAAYDIWALGLSVLETLMPSTDGPFDPNHTFNMCGVLAQYLEWHDDLTRGAPFKLEMLTLCRHDSPFTQTFQQAAAKSPILVSLLLGHLMVRARHRATASEVTRLWQKSFGSDNGMTERWRAHLVAWRAPLSFRDIHGIALHLRLEHENKRRQAMSRPPTSQTGDAPAIQDA